MIHILQVKRDIIIQYCPELQVSCTTGQLHYLLQDGTHFSQQYFDK